MKLLLLLIVLLIIGFAWLKMAQPDEAEPVLQQQQQLLEDAKKVGEEVEKAAQEQLDKINEMTK